MENIVYRKLSCPGELDSRSIVDENGSSNVDADCETHGAIHHKRKRVVSRGLKRTRDA
jgi:hypothetical protein